MSDERKKCPFCGRTPSVSYPLDDTRNSLCRCVNTECPIFGVRCKPDEWDRRADTPEPADGMVMVEAVRRLRDLCCTGYLGIEVDRIIDLLQQRPEPADGMVMVEVLEGGGIWARQMRRDGRLVQCRYNDSHEWYSVTHLHEWDAAEYRLRPAEGGE